MINLQPLTTSRAVHDTYTPDVPTQQVDHKNGTLFHPSACTKMLLIERDGQTFSTTNWFITESNNELIYDIDGNNWVNLDMFNKGESYCKGIYLVNPENESSRVNVVQESDLVIPPFVANWFENRYQDRLFDDDLFDYLLRFNGIENENRNDVVPSDIAEYIHDPDHLIAVLRLLRDDSYEIAES